MRKRDDGSARELEALRERLARLRKATRRASASLDLRDVLPGVLDSARSLTGARYGLMVLVDGSGKIQNLVTSGLMPHEHRQLVSSPDGPELFSHLRQLPGPARFADFHAHTASEGFPAFHLPMPLQDPVAVLMAPVLIQGAPVGSIYVTGNEYGGTFSPQDEEALTMFAAQAGAAIANARRYRDEQLARAELETLVDTSPIGIVVFDAGTGDVLRLNRAARSIVKTLHLPGNPAGELLANISVRRGDGREATLGEIALSDVRPTGETARIEKVVLELPDGRNVTTLMNALPICSPLGEVESVVVTLQDMETLEQAVGLRAEFLGVLGHELHSPLAAIKGSARALLQADADLDKAERREFHRVIVEEADHIEKLIVDLLDVAHIETGALPIERRPVAVPDILEVAYSRFCNGSGRENLQIDIATDLPQVMVDRWRIGQVLDNLLSNADKFSAPTSPIGLAASRTDRHVTISVLDDGRGIAPQHLDAVFGRFFRLHDDSAGRDPGGSGLGLAICKGIVEAHGGRIWAESDGPGLGTRLAFTVPVAQFDDKASSLSIRQVSDGQDVPRVLVVDGDPRALRQTRDALFDAGFEPITTGDPDDVPRLLRAEHPDLVLMDPTLPRTDGIDLMRRILSLADLPVILVSAMDQDDFIARALDVGAVNYIVKPYSPAELAARIRVALRQNAAAHQADPVEPHSLGDLTINYPDPPVTLAGRRA